MEPLQRACWLFVLRGLCGNGLAAPVAWTRCAPAVALLVVPVVSAAGIEDWLVLIRFAASPGRALGIGAPVQRRPGVVAIVARIRTRAAIDAVVVALRRRRAGGGDDQQAETEQHSAHCSHSCSRSLRGSSPFGERNSAQAPPAFHSC